MAPLPAWVLLCLREPATAEAFTAQARALGVAADITRDGILLPGGFLARIEPPMPARALDTSLLEKGSAPDVGVATLVISGGTNDVERSQHQQPALVRQIARDVADQARALGIGADDAVIESSAGRKVRRLTSLVHTLCPLAASVVLPKANNIVFPAEEFREIAATYLEGGAYHFPLWAYLKVRGDRDCAVVTSTGMWLFALPDVAMPLPEHVTTDEAVRALGALQREMVAEGLWFDDGEIFATPLGDVRIQRAWDALFVLPASWEETAAIRAARARYTNQRALGRIVGDHVLHHMPVGVDGVSIEHLLRPNASGIAITNGLSARPLPGSTPEDENQYVELSLVSESLGPWANEWLVWGHQFLRGHDGSRPVRRYDRIVLAGPNNGIAGAIVWPSGHLQPVRAGEPKTSIWELVPFTTDELSRFRADPNAQGAWIDERLERDDIPNIQRRWALALSR